MSGKHTQTQHRQKKEILNLWKLQPELREKLVLAAFLHHGDYEVSSASKQQEELQKLDLAGKQSQCRQWLPC
jgi:hypothetical protein